MSLSNVSVPREEAGVGVGREVPPAQKARIFSSTWKRTTVRL